MQSIIPLTFEKKEAARAEIYRRIGSQYEEHRRHATLWRRMVIEWRVRKEVSAELKRRFPPQALYAKEL